MYTISRTKLMIVPAFLLGFGMGGTSLYVAEAQGLLGLSGSIQHFGATLSDMKKNVDALQQNMASFTKVKDQLTSLTSLSSNPVAKEGETLKQEGQSFQKMIPGFGQ
jgi:hypothetical protein